MDYAKIYRELVSSSNGVEETYFEEHHIIPKCMGGSNDPDNLCYLTPEAHFVAHQLLAKIHRNKSLVHAANMMGNTRITNKSYGWLRKAHAEFASEELKQRWKDPISRQVLMENLIAIHKDPVLRDQHSISLKSRWIDPEQRKELMKGRVGRKINFTEEHCNAISKSRIGIDPWNKGKQGSQEAWNKGKVGISDETRQKMKASSKQRWLKIKLENKDG